MPTDGYSFSEYFATQITEYFADATQMPTPSDPLYVTLFDDTMTELDGNLTNARAPIDATEWSITGTNFENTAEISLGEASTTLENVTFGAVYDSETGGNRLLIGELTEAPFNIANGTNFQFEVGDISADIRDETEAP